MVGAQAEVEEVEHVVGQLTAVVGQRVRRRRVVADQRVHEEAARHLAVSHYRVYVPFTTGTLLAGRAHENENWRVSTTTLPPRLLLPSATVDRALEPPGRRPALLRARLHPSGLAPFFPRLLAVHTGAERLYG